MVTRRRARFAPLWIASVLALSAASAACAGVFGFERLSEDGADGGPPAPIDGATDGTVTDTDAGLLCSSLGVPDPPDASVVDAGAATLAPITMALKLLDFGIDQGAQPVGFNLDHACSPDLATSTCATKIDEPTFDRYGKDRNGEGLDNSGFSLLGYLASLGDSFTPAAINDRLRLGEFGAVIRLSNWNGTPNDDDVFVEVFPAIGVWNPPDGGVETPGGTPTFTTSDEWMRDRRFQNVVDASRIKSSTAWVTGGSLVASFQSVTLPVSVPDDKKPLDVGIREGFVAGKLVPDGASWRLDRAVLGGRWRTSDILAQVRTIYIKGTVGLKDVYLCDPGLIVDVYGTLKKEVCDGRDIRSTSREDSMGLPCDSFSAGLMIDTYAIDNAGDFADLPVLPPRCQQDGSVPEGDDCAPAAP